MRWSAALLVMVGCVPAVRDPVDVQVVQRVGVDPRVAPAIDALLAKPLELDGAIAIAIARNQRLAADLADLGVAAGAIADATVLPSTEVQAAWRDGGAIDVDVVQDVLALVQLPQRRGAAKAAMRAAQARAVAATVELAGRVELAYAAVVAAAQQRELHQTALDAADAALELRTRLHDAGNTTALALDRDLDVREQAALDVARAQAELDVQREALATLLGLDGEAWTVPARLPDAPADAPALDDLEGDAVDASLALIALRDDADAADRRLGVAKVRAWLPTLGVGASAERRDGDWDVGPAIRLGLPIFDHQAGPRRVAAAEAQRARHEAAATRSELRADARAARTIALEAHAAAVRLHDVVIPLRHDILDELVKHFDAMDASTFELITARRDLVDAGHQYVDALLRYWSAMAKVTALRRGVDLEAR